MTTQAIPCVGYWAAHYINRDGVWTFAYDALGRIIRCETKELALSVARYRRRRLRPLRGGNSNLARTERRHGQNTDRTSLFPRKFKDFASLTPASGLAYASGPSAFQTRRRGNLRMSIPDTTHNRTLSLVRDTNLTRAVPVLVLDELAVRRSVSASPARRTAARWVS